MFASSDPNDGVVRLKPASAVALVHVLLGWLLLVGLGSERPAPLGKSLKLFDVTEPPPPPPVEAPVPAQRPSEAEQGAAAPPALKAEPTRVVAPEPVVPIARETIAAAPLAGEGAAPAAGAASVPGPGTGAGGSGAGRGAGGTGTGTGAGGVATRPQLVRGRIRGRDYPAGAYRARAEGEVFVRLQVTADGRVSSCRVESSSGHAELDEATCRLVQRRFRYAPARDARGNPVPDVTGWVQRWWLDQD